MEQQNTLEIRGLKTYFHTRRGIVPAVDGVDIVIPDRSIVGIVGESGCGKSMTAMSIMQLLQYPGRIEEGALADIALIDVRKPAFVPDFNFLSNYVLAADSSCVDTLICGGRILMENRKVEGEEEILAETEKQARRLMKKACGKA